MNMEDNSIPQGGKSVRGREGIVFDVADKVTVEFQNFCLAQVGTSAKIVHEIETCAGCDCVSRKMKQDCLEEATTKKYERLRGKSIPDKACQTRSSSVSMIAASRNWKTKEETEALSRASGEALNHSKMVLADVEYPLPLIQKCGSLKGRRCEAITKSLVELQDSYKFDKHESLVCGHLEFYSKRKNFDMQAALMIERGMAFYYANDLKKCKQLFSDVIRLGDSLINCDLLVGKAYFLLAAPYRRKKKFNRALQYLKKADELFVNQEPGGDKAELYYNYGTLWLDFYSTTTQTSIPVQARQKLKERAIGYYQMAIENCSRDDRPRIQLKFQTYFHLKIAALHLNCGTTAARETSQILDEDIDEAKKRLDFVEFQLSDGIQPSGTRVQLLKTRSDLHYRQGNLRAALEVAKEALTIAQTKQINTDIDPREARIKELDNLLAVPPSPASEMKAACMNDSGWSADSSSSDT